LTQLNAYDVTVNIQTVNGVVAPAAVGGSDFDALPPTTSVTIPAGTLSVTQDVTIINDTEFEGGSTGTPETFTLEYVSGTITQLVMGSPVPVAETAGITLGAAGTGSITDNELPPTVWVIRVDSGTPSMGEVLRDGTDNGVFDPVVFVPLTPFNLVDPLVVNGDAGTQNDRFIVDFVNGNPIPVGGLQLMGATKRRATRWRSLTSFPKMHSKRPLGLCLTSTAWSTHRPVSIPARSSLKTEPWFL